jgi:hypothetical protein
MRTDRGRLTWARGLTHYPLTVLSLGVAIGCRSPGVTVKPLSG